MSAAATATRRPELRRRIRAVPTPLRWLLACSLLIGLAWALLVPPWQSPDEYTHYAYAQSLAERLALPGSADRRTFSHDQRAADSAVGATRMSFNAQLVKPDWSAADDARYRALAARGPSRSDGGGPNAAAGNPPLYYLYADLAYWSAYRGDAFDRLYAMRIWGIALLLTTIAGAWLLAGEVLGRRPLAQLACAALAGLIPMETFMATNVNPDALLTALWTIALWLGARIIVRAAPRRDAIGLGAVTAAAILTKASAYALVPAALLALLIGWRRRPAPERASARRAFGAFVLSLAVPVLAWIGIARLLGRPAVNTINAPAGAHPAPFNLRQFLSYIWQFYLPRLPFLTRFRETSGLPVYDILLKEGWGAFGWLDTWLPGWVYSVLGVLTGALAATAALLVSLIRGRLRLSLLAFFALALVALLFGLHLTEYRSIIAGAGAMIQARYVLPVVSLLGLAGGLVISRLPPRVAAPACAAVLAGLLVLQVLALGTIARMYYT